MLKVGDKVPTLKTTLSDGTELDLSAPGQPLLLYFYPKDDTSGCTREAQDFPLLADDFAKAGVKVVGLSRDPMKKHDRFIEKYALKVPLASDEDGAVSAAFGTWVEKSMYGRKYMGMERATYLIGDDGRVVKAWRKVKVPGHAAEVLKAARATAYFNCLAAFLAEDLERRGMGQRAARGKRCGPRGGRIASAVRRGF